MALAATATLGSSPLVPISVTAAGVNSSGMSVSFGARRMPGISVQVHSRRRGIVAAGAVARGEEGAEKTFVEEMRGVAMRMHTKDQSSEGEKEQRGPSLSELEPNLEAYLRYPRRQQAHLPDAGEHRRPRRRPMVCRVSEYWVREIRGTEERSEMVQ
ncbi:heme oxygenase 1 [Hordeum vulgare]|nr:heme oxygenase 1 [Hordeum vulgare]